MAPIAFGGIISGVDTTSLVDQIIAAQARPILRLESRIDVQEDRKEALGDLRGRLANLLTRALASVSGLSARTAIAGKTATGDKSVISVAVDSTTAVGSFQVSVEQLATTTRVEAATPMGQAVTQNVALDSAGFSATITTGTFTINGTQISIDSSTVLSDGVDDGTSNSILGKINNAGISVTASVVNDPFSNPNLLQLSSASAITLGAGGDTSNFLEAAHLLASVAGSTRTSTQGLGQTQPSVNLDSARLVTALVPTTGSFTINGLTITYDAANESLNDILSKINTAGAGVTASYDANADAVVLTAEQTGSITIGLQDVSGNFLQATGLLGATQTLGQNAAYKIDSGPTQYSTSNTIANAVPGATVTLLAAAPGDNATVTVEANDEAIINAVKAFVQQYNSTLTLVTDLTAANPEGVSGDLAGDSSIRLLAQTLRSLVVGLGDNLTTQYTSLSDLGVTFGAVGAELGATDILQLDEAPLRDAMKEDRNAVIQLLAALSVTATFQSGTGSLASTAGVPDKTQAGTYTITDDGSGNLTVQFDPTDGSTSIVSTGTIIAGGTNKTIIPGMTLTAKGTLQAGADTILVTRDKAGVAVKLENALDAQLRTDGTLDTKTEVIDKLIADMNDRIARLEQRLVSEQVRLERQFARMEQAFARFETQRNLLSGLTSTLNSISSAR